MSRSEFIEDLIIIGGLIGLQFIYAGTSILQKYLMSAGLPQSPFIISLNFVTFLIVSPLAFFFEREAWPKRLSAKLSIQLVLISFAGVTLFQSLTLKGIKLTSPSMATAMPNLAPGLVFLIAWAFRLEKVNLSCTYSRVKIVGTFLCVIGAVTMTIMQSTNKKTVAKDIFPHDPSSLSTEHFYIFDKDQIIGCLYLLAAVIVLSSNVILQALALGNMPAPISLCAITSLIGVMLTVMVEFIEDQTFGKGWHVWSLKQLTFYSLLAGTVSGVCVSFNGYAMKKRGPVLVSMFNPIGAVITVAISRFLGHSIAIGSLTGMFVMFTGLYFVLWAKGKEGFLQKDENEIQSECCDVEKPLLQ
ncbi:hypothetical protein L2E82_47651 [Cichorium intybus]|uniref:Uncharacterized protein n=1 Tax=Cichorium intybus TaxID=13427 RepID=A0ACB8YWT4_CICIN|nr:hypothetical protein L2E82_47651 [Cichorium intybus]